MKAVAAGMLAGSMTIAPQALAAEDLGAPDTVELEVGEQRVLPVRIWSGEGEPTAVALFSHGYNSWPAAYDELVARLLDEGFVVVAPLHLDSLRSSVEGKIGPQEGFAARLSDMGAASALVGERYPDLPVLAVGHSFGSLVSLTRAGGLPALGDLRDARVSAVLAFSSPGKIPGLIGDDAFTGVTLPVMLVTGEKDVVPGFVADPADHLIYSERTAGSSYVVSFEEGDHDLVSDGAMLDRSWPAIAGFISAHVAKDADTGVTLDTFAVEKSRMTSMGGAQ